MYFPTDGIKNLLNYINMNFAFIFLCGLVVVSLCWEIGSEVQISPYSPIYYYKVGENLLFKCAIGNQLRNDARWLLLGPGNDPTAVKETEGHSVAFNPTAADNGTQLLRYQRGEFPPYTYYSDLITFVIDESPSFLVVIGSVAGCLVTFLMISLIVWKIYIRRRNEVAPAEKIKPCNDRELLLQIINRMEAEPILTSDKKLRAWTTASEPLVPSAPLLTEKFENNPVY